MCQRSSSIHVLLELGYVLPRVSEMKEENMKRTVLVAVSVSAALDHVQLNHACRLGTCVIK